MSVLDPRISRAQPPPPPHFFFYRGFKFAQYITLCRLQGHIPCYVHRAPKEVRWLRALRFAMAKFTCFVAVLVTAMLLAGGAEAGNYRRILLAYGEVTGYAVNNHFGQNATCYDIPMYDFPTNVLVGTAQDCLSGIIPDTNCTMGMSLTATTNFSIGTDSFVNRA